MNRFMIRGLGFFNDAYDLFIMNIINVVLTEQYGKAVYTSHMKSMLSAAAIVGAILGQLLFGYFGDVFGRKLSMIATCLLLIVGGVLCACAHGPTDYDTLVFLAVARLILGVGIGGEYPLAASSTAEDSATPAERNKRVAMTFSLQGVGLVTSALLGNLIIQALASGEPGENSQSRLETVWRLLFAIGVLPAVVVCYWRVTVDETDAFKVAQHHARVASARSTIARTTRFFFILRNYGWGLLGTAGTWFLFDIVFYAQNLFSASILSVIGVNDASLQQITAQNAFIALMTLPGYYVAIHFINKMGRKVIQLQGFAVMTIIFICLGTFWGDIKKSPVLFIILYGLSLFFCNFGPNTSTFVMPTEMFPTPIRATCHGFSAACGKAGAAIGTFGFSIWVENDRFGYSGAFYTFAAISFIALPLTYICMFDNNIGLEEMDIEFFNRLHIADEFTRDVFASVAKLEDPYKLTATEPSLEDSTI